VRPSPPTSRLKAPGAPSRSRSEAVPWMERDGGEGHACHPLGRLRALETFSAAREEQKTVTGSVDRRGGAPAL